ncbi:DUF21 domain-containing protein [Rhodococcus hoagii]|nr:DUF21 domain-containing protein [Prescottella equi]
MFAATEIALVSLREGQLRALEQHGRRGERAGRARAESEPLPASVQIGVTVAGFFSAAYGASTLAPNFSPTLRHWGLSAGTGTCGARRDHLGDLVPVAGTGRTRPQSIALQSATGVALVTAPPLDRVRPARPPVIWLLSLSTKRSGADPRRRSRT